MKYNKFSAIRTVVLSSRSAADKAMLVELILCCDSDWYCFPSVQRLCQARGMKHEKNFKGAQNFLPGLITTHKRGRKNGYTLNIEAIMALEPALVIIKHTPSTAGEAPVQEGENAPSPTDIAPAVEDKNPAEQGAYSTRDITADSTSDSTRESTKVVAGAPTLVPSTREESLCSSWSSLTEDVPYSGANQKSDRTEGSGSALEDKGHLVASGGHLVASGSSIWDAEW